MSGELISDSDGKTMEGEDEIVEGEGEITVEGEGDIVLEVLE